LIWYSYRVSHFDFIREIMLLVVVLTVVLMVGCTFDSGGIRRYKIKIYEINLR